MTNKIEGEVLTFDDTSTHTLDLVQDRAFFEEETEDPSVRTEFEAGYVASRPRHVRTALRRTWKSGYTDISDADKKQFSAFYNEVKGGSIAFEWVDQFDPAYIAVTDPTWTLSINDALVYKVRFTTPFKPERNGHGSTLNWNIPFEIEEL